MTRAEIPDVPRYYADDLGGIWHKWSFGFKRIKPWACRNKNGTVYLKVDLGRTVRAKFVHRLVLMAFVGKPPEGRGFACHLDDDPANNKLSNMKWADQSTNERHKTFSPCTCGCEMADHHDEAGYCTAVRPDGSHCECREYVPAKRVKNAVNSSK
jgi:HNH endonuclease